MNITLHNETENEGKVSRNMYRHEHRRGNVEKLLEVLPISKTQLIMLPYTGHPSIHYLDEVNLLKDIVIKIANEGNVHGIKFLENKRLSKSYFQYLSHNLLKRNHLKWALSAIESAIQIDERVAWFHGHKSEVLDRLGRTEEAIVTINKAIALEPNNPSHQHHLISLQNKLRLH